MLRHSKTATLILTTLMSLSFILFAQEPVKPIEQKPEQPQTPQLSDKASISLSEESFDFGYVYPGAKVTHTIKITNVGTDTLRLERPRPSCGCTVAPLKKYILAPGESEELDIVFNSMGYNRPTTKSVAIPSNDAKKPMVNIVFTANMDTTSFPKIMFEPRIIDFGQGNKMKNKMEIEITNKTTEIYKLSLGPMPREFANWTLNKGELKPDQKAKLMINLSPNLTPENYFSGSFYIAFSSDKDKFRMSLPFSGGGQGSGNVVPPAKSPEKK